MSLEYLQAMLVANQQRLEFWKRQLQASPSDRVSGVPQTYIRHYEQQIAALERVIKAMRGTSSDPRTKE
jgi:hypothetical protein